MVSLQAVHAHNAALKSRPAGLVGVFVGGTSGIALSTALSFARHTSTPRIYLVGRSAPAANTAIETIKSLNPTATTTFLQSDLSLLSSVDTLCTTIAARESHINLLFMTPGYMTTAGRVPTAEGLDRKFALHYYARMRLVTNLAPLLTAAAQHPTKLSRVVSVLDPHASIRLGGAGKLDFTDLSLAREFSLNKCQAHATLMGNFFLEGMARRWPQTTFIHAYPSGVATGIFRDMPITSKVLDVLKPVLGRFLVPLEESGERHLFAGTSGRFTPSEGAEREEGDVAVGSDGVEGSGCYWASWDGEVFPPNKRLEKLRGDGAVEKVVKHTEEVFQKVCEEGKTYP